MSKLNIDQKTIKDLFSDKKADFLIPDYQRPYAWGDKECQTLWDDIFTFAFPDDDCTKFNSDNDEYFLGPIVTFKNNSKQEVIDGQQRLTTLMLVLRAFYDKYSNMKDEQSIKTRELIEKCIWKTDEFGNPQKSFLKIDSEVATDKDKEEFLSILRTGVVGDKQKSSYAQNYRFFQAKINEFLQRYPSYFSYLPVRILNNCILLPIEAESQDTALRIFSTLNDRGKPLSDADIFKAQLYKFYTNRGEKDEFIRRWKDLEQICERIFRPISGTPMDEVFTRYMYYERAKMGLKSSTTEALRKFYERNGYELLKKEETFDNIVDLAVFWRDIYDQNTERFSDAVLRRLFVFNFAPNSMWTYFLSVYYMCNRDGEGLLEEEALLTFLDKAMGFIWTYAVTNPGVNSLRTPVFAEMVNLVEGRAADFSAYLLDEPVVKTAFANYLFSNNRPATRSMLAWWAFNDDQQALISSEKTFEIEHIFARARQDKEHSLTNPKPLESLGNKVLLEERINIRASDYRFEDKKKYYLGYVTTKGKTKPGTEIHELHLLSEWSDFTESSIRNRYADIIGSFISFLRRNDLFV